MRVFGSSTLQPVPGGTYRTPLSSGYRVHPKYRIARSCGSLPGQSSPAAAAGHREAKSSRRILPTELQLEPLLFLLLQTLLVQSMCHGCYLSLYPATAIADYFFTESVQCLLKPPDEIYYCYGFHQSANSSISRQQNSFTNISNGSLDRYFVAFVGHHGLPEPPVLISLAGRISPK